MIVERKNMMRIGQIALTLLALATISALGSYARREQGDSALTAARFEQLMQTISDGWNEGNARKAADCYTEDAIYSAPPDPKIKRGRATLYDFFGGDRGREAPMRMVWHHLGFNERSQIGFGEYTFQYKEYQAHGVVVVKLQRGKISNWREYEQSSNLNWEEFVGENKF